MILLILNVLLVLNLCIYVMMGVSNYYMCVRVAVYSYWLVDVLYFCFCICLCCTW